MFIVLTTLHMKIAFVCCPEITGLPHGDQENPREYVIMSRLAPDGEVTGGRVRYKDEKHECATTWTFEYKEQDGFTILFVILLGDTEIGRLALPLRWFEPNTVCTQVFPVKIVTGDDWKVMMQVRLHLCENGEPPFLAREAPMRVKPAWDKKPEGEPKQSENGRTKSPLAIQETLTVYVHESPAPPQQPQTKPASAPPQEKAPARPAGEAKSPGMQQPQVLQMQPGPVLQQPQGKVPVLQPQPVLQQPQGKVPVLQPQPVPVPPPGSVPQFVYPQQFQMPMYFVDPKTGQAFHYAQPAVVPVKMPDGSVQMMPVYPQPMPYPMSPPVVLPVDPTKKS